MANLLSVVYNRNIMENIQTNNYTSPENIESKPIDPESRDQAIVALASEFHEDWRKTRIDDEGKFEPRIKGTSDSAWIESHGTDQVDIANTAFADLPRDWQTENHAAAEVVVDIVNEYGGLVDVSDPEVRRNVGDRIHQAWLSRNEWAKGGELDVPFDKLPEDEQDKDINQISVALRVFSS